MNSEPGGGPAAHDPRRLFVAERQSGEPRTFSNLAETFAYAQTLDDVAQEHLSLVELIAPGSRVMVPTSPARAPPPEPTR
jgi:hypothetical protein